MRDKWTQWRENFGSETDYIIKLWSCFSDPEQQSSFLEAVKQRKKDNPAYSIYDDYPRSENAAVRAREECCEFVAGLRKPKKEESA